MENDNILSKGIEKAQNKDVARISGLLAPDYEVIGLIGSGGMGNVYFGHSQKLNGKEVAIKVLHPEYSSDTALKARFIREAELLQKVNHPNVVKFYDARSEDGIAFYAMECITGISLEQYIKKGMLPFDKVADLIIALCEALNAVHSVGIIHRDLKPANILITDDFKLKLTDFGIARPEDSELTHHNEIVGSVCYIAPEIWVGEEPTPSVDLYSLGILLYEILTGEVPFDGSSPGELMRKHLQTVPIAPRDKNPEIPHYLNRITLSLLSKSKFDRPKNALQVISKIKKAIGSVTGAHPFVTFEHDTREFLRVMEEESSSKLPTIQRDKEETEKNNKQPDILSELNLKDQNPENKISIIKLFLMFLAGLAIVCLGIFLVLFI